MRIVFFFNDTATTEIYTLSLHDALPILVDAAIRAPNGGNLQPWNFVVVRDPELKRRIQEYYLDGLANVTRPSGMGEAQDRKSTRLNSSHANISYAVFCLKKKRQLSARLH